MDYLPKVGHPELMRFLKLVTMYIVVGCALGFAEFTIAKVVLRNSPRRKTLLTRENFWKCMGMNALAWPGILVWLALLGLLKGVIFYRSRPR